MQTRSTTRRAIPKARIMKMTKTKAVFQKTATIIRWMISTADISTTKKMTKVHQRPRWNSKNIPWMNPFISAVELQSNSIYKRTMTSSNVGCRLYMFVAAMTERKSEED